MMIIITIMLILPPLLLLLLLIIMIIMIGYANQTAARGGQIVILQWPQTNLRFRNIVIQYSLSALTNSK